MSMTVCIPDKADMLLRVRVPSPRLRCVSNRACGDRPVDQGQIGFSLGPAAGRTVYMTSFLYQYADRGHLPGAERGQPRARRRRHDGVREGVGPRPLVQVGPREPRLEAAVEERPVLERREER